MGKRKRKPKQEDEWEIPQALKELILSGQQYFLDFDKRREEEKKNAPPPDTSHAA